MPPGRSPETADEPIFAVLVDPAAVAVGKVALYRALRDGLAVLGRKPPATDWAELVSRLEAGPTTVAQGLTRSEARTLAEWLQAHAIQAKLRRTGAAGARPDLPPRVPASPAEPGAVPEPAVSPGAAIRTDVPARLPPARPDRTELSAEAAEAPAKRRPTMMEGWAQSLAPPTGETAEIRRDTVVDPPPTEIVEPGGPEPGLRESAGLLAVASVPGILGWQQIVLVGDDADAGRRAPKPAPALAAEAPSPPGRVPKPVHPVGLPKGQPPTRGAPPPPPLTRSSPSMAALPAPDPAPPAPAAPPAVEPVPAGVAVAAAPPAAPGPEVATRAPAPIRPAARLQPAADLDELPGRPIPLEELLPSPGLALALGIAAPGAGELYLGRDDVVRRVTLSAPLVLPWIRSAREARLEAEQMVARRRAPRGRPRLVAALLFAAAFWVVVGTLVWGAVALYGVLTGPTRSDVAVVGPEAAPQVESGERARPDAPDGELSREVAQRQVQARARQLFSDAAEACRLGAWARCAALSDEARQLDPELHQAVRLYHQATLQLEQNRSACEGSGGGDCP